jgi:hypothetical protein
VHAEDKRSDHTDRNEIRSAQSGRCGKPDAQEIHHADIDQVTDQAQSMEHHGVEAEDSFRPRPHQPRKRLKVSHLACGKRPLENARCAEVLIVLQRPRIVPVDESVPEDWNERRTRCDDDCGDREQMTRGHRVAAPSVARGRFFGCLKASAS